MPGQTSATTDAPRQLSQSAVAADCPWRTSKKLRSISLWTLRPPNPIVLVLSGLLLIVLTLLLCHVD